MSFKKQLFKILCFLNVLEIPGLCQAGIDLNNFTFCDKTFLHLVQALKNIYCTKMVRCEADTRCKGFNMDYNRNECQAVTKNSDNNLFNLRTSSGVSYFEAICLQGNITMAHK